MLPRLKLFESWGYLMERTKDSKSLIMEIFLSCSISLYVWKVKF